MQPILYECFAWLLALYPGHSKLFNVAHRKVGGQTGSGLGMRLPGCHASAHLVPFASEFEFRELLLHVTQTLLREYSVNGQCEDWLTLLLGRFLVVSAGALGCARITTCRLLGAREHSIAAIPTSCGTTAARRTPLLCQNIIIERLSTDAHIDVGMFIRFWGHKFGKESWAT